MKFEFLPRSPKCNRYIPFNVDRARILEKAINANLFLPMRCVPSTAKYGSKQALSIPPIIWSHDGRVSSVEDWCRHDT